jgi:D-glycero-alpha-D-manno-heptose-7-phosphate kinase
MARGDMKVPWESRHYNALVHLDTSAPTRVDLAGGTIDIWPLYLFHADAQTIHFAISLRAHARLSAREDGRVAIESRDTGARVEADGPTGLHAAPGMALLGRLVEHFAPRGITLTTRGESPAGAGIAGSSAMNVAVCAGLARWCGMTIDPELLLSLAMNVEAQAIAVPTGLQDFRPAMYGGIAALELTESGARRVPLDVNAAELTRRIVLAYTGEPRQSGTNNWEIYKRHIDGDRRVFDAFERIRDTAAALRRALEREDWDEIGRQIAAEWENRKRLAPGVTTPAVDGLIDRAMHAGATAAKVCGAGGGGCLICYAAPADVPAVREALLAGGARVLEYRIETEGLRFG